KKREEEHHRESGRLTRRLEGLPEVRSEDVSAAEASLATAESERDGLDRALEEVGRSLPAAEQWEALLAERQLLSQARTAQQETRARAAEIRAGMSELIALEPLLRPLREAAHARQELAAATRAATSQEPRLEALRAAEAEAEAAEVAARTREEQVRENE